MRGFVVMIVLPAVLLAACSRQPEPTSSAAAPAETANPTAPAEPTTQSQPAPLTPPTESSLSIKRGVVMLAQDRTTFRPCSDKAELWIVDQTDGVLQQAFAEAMQKGPAMLYVEARGERAPLADDVPAAARAYAGTFVLEEVLYAGLQGEVRGCEEPDPDYIVAARGSEPFWSVAVGGGDMVWHQAEEPKQITLGPPQTQDSEGAARYHASRNGHELELLIDTQSCRDPMSGEYFAYAAKASLDKKEFSGCARVGE